MTAKTQEIDIEALSEKLYAIQNGDCADCSPSEKLQIVREYAAEALVLIGKEPVR